MPVVIFVLQESLRAYRERVTIRPEMSLCAVGVEGGNKWVPNIGFRIRPVSLSPRFVTTNSRAVGRSMLFANQSWSFFSTVKRKRGPRGRQNSIRTLVSDWVRNRSHDLAELRCLTVAQNVPLGTRA